VAQGRFRLRSNVGFATRDGIRLSTDVYLPPGDGPFPTVLMRTPYDNTLPWMRAKAGHYADLGYAVAIQDCRGRFDSDGTYEPFRNEGRDGVDALAWLRGQAWCNGRIGMAGRSYSGWTQWTAATEAGAGAAGPDAIVPRVMATDLHRGLMWRGGAFNIGVLLTWGLMTSGRSAQTLHEIDWVDAFRRLPLADAAAEASQDVSFWRDWLEHPTRDAYWDGVDAEARLDAVSAPAVVMGGWYDLYADDAPRQFSLLQTRGATPEARASRLVMGAWPHSLSASTLAGGVDFGNEALFDLDLLEERWFDRWLRDVRNGVDEEAPAKLFVMGAGEWRDASGWPLPETEWQEWYLHSGGGAATLRGDGSLSAQPPGDEPADSFVYDPDFPVPTNGGPNCCSPEIVPWGAYDQRGLEMRSDVLVYTSEPLAQDLQVIGPVRVVLHAATDGPDTDWTAKLVDVRPSGFAMNLCDGILRARFRHGFDEERPVEPGSVERYEIDLMATANVFRAGHRMRLEISSSNFPRFDRNPNTGGRIGQEPTVRRARQTVLHAGARASHLLLPVIPASGR
jgi:putative CocE/NonD family hydrolase